MNFTMDNDQISGNNENEKGGLRIYNKQLPVENRHGTNGTVWGLAGAGLVERLLITSRRPGVGWFYGFVFLVSFDTFGAQQTLGDVS